MSPGALDAVKAELEQLSGPVRAEIVERIAAAREEGDLKENGGYHAAKDEQGKLEARIRQLTEIVRVADTSPSPDDQIVSPGKVVTTSPEFTDDDGPFLLAMRTIDDAYPDNVNLISPQSPLGAALLGAAKGETRDFSAPNGKTIKVTIVDVTPYA
ncbi:MAG: transcription elongation factor GreA [Nocardioidaceae bacterium]